MSIEKAKYLSAMLLILLLAFALGARGLNYDPIWADELASVTFMGAFDPPYNLSQVMASVQQYSPDHVPLYFFLGALWGQFAGWSQFSLRLISLLFGVLMVAWLYRFATDSINPRTAIVAALLMSTSAFVILFFHDVRMYTMLMWLAILHSWLYWRLAHGFRVTKLTWLLFVMTTSALFYTHNFSMILFAGLGIYHLIFVKRSRRWLRIILAWAVGALVFLPYAPLVVGGLRFNQGVTVNPLPTIEVAELFTNLMVNGFTWLWLPLLLLFGIALWRQRNPTVLRLLFIVLVMIAAVLLINWRFNVITITRLRYFLITWFVTVNLFAFGLTAMPNWRVATGLFLLLWCVAAYQFEHSGEVIKYAGLMARDRSYPPMHEYVFNLRNKTKSQDFLLGFTEDDRVSRVSPNSSHSTSDYYLGAQLDIDGVFLHAREKRYRLERDVRSIMRDHPHILLAHDPSEPPLNYSRTLEIIRESYIPCAILVDNPDLLIQRHAHPVMGCGHDSAPIEYDNGIKIIDQAASYDVQAGSVQVLSWWDVPDPSMLGEFNVSLQIIAPDWQNLRQVDRHLYDDLVPWSVIELPTDGLPAGDYRVMLILYNRNTGAKVNGIDRVSGETAHILSLLTFRNKPNE